MSWNTNYAFLILASTIITYFSGILILDTDNDNGKKWIAISFIINLAILFFFKYFNFFSNRIEEAFRLFTIKMNVPNLDTLLPVGISFYTFQALSYTVDIYRGKLSPEKHLGKHVADIYLDRKLKENQIKKIDLWFYKPKTFGIGRQTIYQAKY